MSFLGLLAWERFKLRGRRIVWLLLLVAVAFAAFMVLLRFGEYQFRKDASVRDELVFLPGSPKPDDEIDVDCQAFLDGEIPTDLPAPLTVDDIDVGLTTNECTLEIEGVRERLVFLVEDFTLPGATAPALRWTGMIAIPLVAFFTVLLVGSEYAWGTLRTNLSRGVGRRRLLAAKLALVAAAVAVMWLVVLAVVMLTSVVATAIVAGVGHGDWTGGAVGDLIADLLKVWFSGLPYVTLAALLSILFSRWASGTVAAAAVSVGYFFFNLFSMARVIQLFEGQAGFGWVADLARFDLGWNSAAWLFGKGGEPIRGFNLVGAIGRVAYPGDLWAFLVQAAYTALFAGIAFWLFTRRDVTGPSG